MVTSKKILANRLLYLPIDLNEKVLLWLTYRNLKPVSEITVIRRNLPQLRRLLRQGKLKSKPETHIDESNPKIKRIRKWIQDANLYCMSEQGYDIAWHIGRDRNNVRQSVKILHRFDYQSELQSGILFGFPKESAEAYAHNRITKNEKDKIPMISPFETSPYMFYSVRADRIKEDGKVAIKWADTIRKEVPILAEWFENHSRRQK